MATIPAKLQEARDDFSFITNRTERQEYLIQLADDFKKVKVPFFLLTGAILSSK